MTTSYDVSRQVVQKLGGDPNNKNIVRAVAIWLRFESGGTIFGNNPWNMRPGSDYGNVCTKGVDGKNFVKFCTINDGTTAVARRLSKNDYRGYAPIGAAIRRGDPIAMFYALARSKWSADHYGGGTKLIGAFNSSLPYNYTVAFRDRAGGTGGGTSPGTGGTTGGIVPVNYAPGVTLAAITEFLSSIGGSISDPLITPGATPAANSAKRDAFLNWLRQKGLIGSGDMRDLAVGTAYQRVAAKGGTWADLPAELANTGIDPGKVVADIGQSIQDVAKALGDAFGWIAQVGAFLLDTENWLYMGSVTFGGILVVVGGRYVIAATGANAPEVPKTITTETITKPGKHPRETVSQSKVHNG